MTPEITAALEEVKRLDAEATTAAAAFIAAELRNFSDHLQSAQGGWRDNDAALLNEAADTMDSLASELERVRKENASLRAALKPFADCAGELDGSEDVPPAPDGAR